MLKAYLKLTEYFLLQYGFVFSYIFIEEVLTLALHIIEERYFIL